MAKSAKNMGPGMSREARTEVLHVRLDKRLLKRIQALADGDRRSSSSQIYLLLLDAVSAEENRRAYQG